MSNWNDAFPSSFLKADDITAPCVVTIAAVATEIVGADTKEPKLVVTFVEPTAKKVTLNKTRCEALEALSGSANTDDWIGLRIQISRGRTRYGSNTVNCIVFGPVPIPPRARKPTAAAPVPPAPPPAPAAASDDDIDFAFGANTDDAPHDA